MLALAVLVSFVLNTLILAAPDNVCSNGLYKEFVKLSTYPPAQSFCSSRYPPKTTITVTVTGVKLLKRASSSQKSSIIRLSTQKSTSIQKSSTKGDPGENAVWSSLIAKAGAVVSTLCSCIQTFPTTTVTMATVSICGKTSSSCSGSSTISGTKSIVSGCCSGLTCANDRCIVPTTTTSTTSTIVRQVSQVVGFGGACDDYRSGDINYAPTATLNSCLTYEENYGTENGVYPNTVANANPASCYQLLFFATTNCQTTPISSLLATKNVGGCVKNPAPGLVGALILTEVPVAACQSTSTAAST